MSPETPTGPHSGLYTGKQYAEGRRWYDSAKVVWALIGGISFIIVCWGSVVYTNAMSAQTKNVEHDVRINSLEVKVDKIDAKLDRILERMPK